MNAIALTNDLLSCTMVLARQAMQFAGIDVSYDKRIEKGHHRTEIREVWSVPVAAISELYQPQPWVGIHCVVMVVRVRHLTEQNNS